MKLIVGLGNPGTAYERTRHNAGFLFLDGLARAHKAAWKKVFSGELATIMLGDKKVLLFKPLTYMNCSGEPLQKILSFYKLSILDILVIHDDVDLLPSTVRFREKGSSGGHNGLNSIIRELGSDTFARVKIGIGRPQHSAMAVADYVLQRFTPEELLSLESAFKTTELQMEKWLKG